MSWKASGTDSASTNVAAIAPNIATRPRPSSARTTLPSHANPTQHHHRSARTSRPRSEADDAVRSCAISAVTRVSENTNTRSKNSSIGVTRASSETDWIVRVMGLAHAQDGTSARRTLTLTGGSGNT